MTISGTDLRCCLAEGREIPPWFTPPAVAAELRGTFPPRCSQGFTVFFTGTLRRGQVDHRERALRQAARARRPSRHAAGRRYRASAPVVRAEVFTRASRSEHHAHRLRRREITKNGGIAVCAPIAPYDKSRRAKPGLVEPTAVVSRSTSPRRSRSARSATARGSTRKRGPGWPPQFTGISDPYEEPTDAELVIDTRTVSVGQAAARIVDYLRGSGYLRP